MTKESVHEDIMPHKTAYYNNVYGEIYFLEIGGYHLWSYHLWSSSVAPKSTFLDSFNINATFLFLKPKAGNYLHKSS